MLLLISCGSKSDRTGQRDPDNKGKIVHEIETVKEFNDLIDNSAGKILIVDFHANWCAPCKTLSPLLEKIAKEYTGKASFYKVNVDELRVIASRYQVTGIPYVVFFKDKKIAYSLVGLRSEQDYNKVIDALIQ
ncbi:MAG: thioredoxin family protein [Spirochaetes bacterium]|nr:thioredoxin family protein [Spirochaetota bacterium]